MTDLSKYLTEDFPENLTINVGSRHSFGNYDKINNWIQNEIEFHNALNKSDFVRILVNEIKNQLEPMFRQSRHIDYTINQLLKEIKELIERVYKINGLISSKSKVGKWIANISKLNSSLVYGAYEYFRMKTFGTSNHNLDKQYGHFAAYIFDKGLESSLEYEKEQYNEFFEELTIKKDSLIKALKELQLENETIKEESKTLKEYWRGEFKKLNKNSKENFDNTLLEHTNKMKDSEDFYEKKLAVKNAVTYWSDKSKSHIKSSYIFGIISLVLIIALFISVFSFGKYLINIDLNSENNVNNVLTKNGALQYWVYGFFIVCLSLFVWVIKLMVKVFLSNLHLYTDCKERETMILTYLAFEREEKTLKDTDRDLILPSIFRTSSNGYIKDDSSPKTPINIVSKKITDS